MNVMKRTCGLAVALGLFATGCPEEPANNDGVVDASVMDASMVPDASGDAGTFACTSYTPPNAATNRCGGSHCQQSPQQLRMDTPASAACGTQDEVDAFCSLEAVDVVGDCAVEALGVAEGTRACAKEKLPKLSDGCLDCYVASASCTAKCISVCFPDRKNAACDACRVREGCIDEFYTCAGFVNPLPR